MQGNTSGEVERVVVIGAGVFGCNVALAIANAGYDVALIGTSSRYYHGYQ